jgi:hypothetical protein
MRREKETAAVGFFNFFMVSVCSWQGNPGTETMGRRRSRGWLSLFMVVYGWTLLFGTITAAEDLS